MGVQEALYVVGAIILLGVLIYAVSVAGRKRQSPESAAKTRELYDADGQTGAPKPKVRQADEP